MKRSRRVLLVVGAVTGIPVVAIIAFWLYSRSDVITYNSVGGLTGGQPDTASKTAHSPGSSTPGRYPVRARHLAPAALTYHPLRTTSHPLRATSHRLR